MKILSAVQDTRCGEYWKHRFLGGWIAGLSILAPICISCAVVFCWGTIFSKYHIIDLKGVIFQMIEVGKYAFLIS